MVPRRKCFTVGKVLNQRDLIAVRKTFSGLMKLLYPHDEYTKAEVEEELKYALVGRRRLKEQLKKMQPMEFYDVNFSNVDIETQEEMFVSVPEMGSDKLIPDGQMKPGHSTESSTGRTVASAPTEWKSRPRAAQECSRAQAFGRNTAAKEAVDIAFRYFKANTKKISSQIRTLERDYHLNVQDLHGAGVRQLTLMAFVAVC